MIRAVIFDIDGTLLDSFEANLEFFQNLIEMTGYQPPTREEYVPLFHRTLKDTVKEITKLTDENEIQRIWELAHTANLKTKSPTMPVGAAEAVKTLSEKYSLAIATSRIITYAYEPPFDTLKPYFKVTVTYEDTEKHKPDPDPLLLAAERLGVSPENCVYIGDVETDMKAALAANMKFILYGKENLIGADAHIFDFKDLPKVIENL